MLCFMFIDSHCMFAHVLCFLILTVCLYYAMSLLTLTVCLLTLTVCLYYASCLLTLTVCYIMLHVY